MIVYLAGGFTVMFVKGRERELARRYKYNRLFSFYFLSDKKENLCCIKSFEAFIKVGKK